MSVKLNFIVKIKIVLLVILFVNVKIGYTQTNLSSLTEKEEIKTSITYCNLDIPKDLKSVNITFSIYYMFKVDESGEVVSIKKERDDYVGEKIVKSCILNWKVMGVPDNTWFGVNFFWSRNKGWFRQTLQSYKLNFNQIMEMEGVGIKPPQELLNKEKP